MASRVSYRWSEPASAEAERGPAAVVGGWTAMVSMSGRWSHCDLWFIGAAAYVGRPFRILGRTGGIWAVLASGTIGVPALLSPNGALGDRTGILASVRGRPCEGLLVEVANSVAVVVPPAKWRLHAWGRESDQPTTVTGGPTPPIWTNRHSPIVTNVYVASAAPCLINCAFARNDSAGTRFFQVHDLAGAPGAGAVPCQPGLPLLTTAPGSIAFDAAQMLNGVTLVSSLTAAAYTADPGASLDMGALIQ